MFDGCLPRSKLLTGQPNGEKLPDSVYLLPDKPQVRGMHTVIRNKETKRDDFVFFTNRLSCLVIEHAFSLLPFEVSFCSSLFHFSILASKSFRRVPFPYRITIHP